MTTSWIQVAQEALKLPGILVEIYGDLAKPGVKQVGRALDTILGLGNTILWPLAIANEKSRIYLERNLEKFRERLKDVPDENIVPIAPEVGVPLAEKLAYTSDVNLTELYVNLLATAANKDTVEWAHPSFTHIINSLSPDEAILLGHFAGNAALPFIRGRWTSPPNNSLRDASDILMSSQIQSDLVFPSNIPAYFNNLSGLGIVEIRWDEYLDDAEAYSALFESWRDHVDSSPRKPPNSELQFFRGSIYRTQLGYQFMRACSQR